MLEAGGRLRFSAARRRPAERTIRIARLLVVLLVACLAAIFANTCRQHYPSQIIDVATMPECRHRPKPTVCGGLFHFKLRNVKGTVGQRDTCWSPLINFESKSKSGNGVCKDIERYLYGRHEVVVVPDGSRTFRSSTCVLSRPFAAADEFGIAHKNGALLSNTFRHFE